MNTQRLRLLVLALAALLAAATNSRAQSPDEKAIRDVEIRQQTAWNNHDAREYAKLFPDDGDVVNVVGWWWKGRAEIEKKLTDAFAWVFRDSTLTITEVKVRFLTPQIAVAHVRWTMAGAKTPPNIPEPKQGIQTQVLEKRAGKWLITAMQNTNGVPETPFPKGPPEKR
ncbi:MAG: SgcJ/EcaC family oxidoreductase [Acidipila sp.]|nr:SgcJ/EcaC family oxidoreductase [Acidipila sp.]